MKTGAKSFQNKVDLVPSKHSRAVQAGKAEI